MLPCALPADMVRPPARTHLPASAGRCWSGLARQRDAHEWQRGFLPHDGKPSSVHQRPRLPPASDSSPFNRAGRKT